MTKVADAKNGAVVEDADALISRSLIQLVRDRTGTNFTNSRLAVHAVIEHLISMVGNNDVGEAIANAARVEAPDATDGGADMVRLEGIFSELTAMKNDAQQRSWAIDDDFEVNDTANRQAGTLAAPYWDEPNITL